MQFLAGGVGLMFALIFAELFFLKRIRREALPWREIVTNLHAGHAVLWLFRGVEILVYLTVFRAVSLGWVSDWHPVALFVFTFVAFDFSYYWSHRTHHTLPALWRVHVVHHQAEHFSLSMGIRNSYFSVLTAMPFFLWLAVVGVPLEVYVAASGLNYFIQFYNHNGVVDKSGWLERILITPSHHRVHHGTHRVYRNKNHGGVLVLWDRLFGTFQPELDLPRTYGLAHHTPDYNPLRVNLKPLFGKFSDRISGSRPVRRSYPTAYLLSGSAALTGAFLAYIYLGELHSGWAVYALLIYVFAGTLCLGSIAEGAPHGVLCWLLLTVGWGPFLLLLTGLVAHPLFLFAFFGLAAHGLWGIRYLEAPRS